MPKLYLDVCCLNRPFDDQTQARIHLEAEAVLVILARCAEEKGWEWIASEAVEWEVDQTPDPERRRRVGLLAAHACQSVPVGGSEVERAQEINRWGVSALDALHLACAESGGAEVFLTTDDRLLHKARAHTEKLNVRVENPLAWLGEES